MFQSSVVVLVGVVLVVGSGCVSKAESKAKAQQAFAKGQEYMQSQKWLPAIECFREATQRDPDFAEAYLMCGTAINEYVVAGYANAKPPSDHTREDAIRYLDRCLSLKPGCGEAYLQKGYAFSGLAKVAEAREAFSKAIPLLKDPTKALIERAALAFMQFDYKAAVADQTAVIDSNPPAPEYYSERAMYRKFAGDPKGAQSDEQQAKRLREQADADKKEN
jgi:tetratricopeptide (TPR) repeat protein